MTHKYDSYDMKHHRRSGNNIISHVTSHPKIFGQNGKNEKSENGHIQVGSWDLRLVLSEVIFCVFFPPTIFRHL